MTNHCTHAQAIALKEIGFDMAVRDYYDKYGDLYFNGHTYNWNRHDVQTSAPTRSEVLQWAREKHNIDTWVEPYLHDGIKAYFYCCVVDNVHGSSVMEYPTYPEAEDALIDKFIEIIKKQIR